MIAGGTLWVWLVENYLTSIFGSLVVLPSHANCPTIFWFDTLTQFRTINHSFEHVAANCPMSVHQTAPPAVKLSEHAPSQQP